MHIYILMSDREMRRKGKRRVPRQKMKREIIKEKRRREPTREERERHIVHALPLFAACVSPTHLSFPLLSFSSSLLSVSLFPLPSVYLFLFAPDSRFFPSRTFIPAISQRRCRSFFRVSAIFVASLHMQLSL